MANDMEHDGQRADAAAEAEAKTDARADDNAEALAGLIAERDELKDRVLRTLAEMENLRRRTEREVADARTYAVTNFARDMLNAPTTSVVRWRACRLKQPRPPRGRSRR